MQGFMKTRNELQAKSKYLLKHAVGWPITTPIVLGGDIYPALGGDIPGSFAYSSLQSLASNVTGITVPLSGHWIPEEQPKFVIDQLFKFFGDSSK